MTALLDANVLIALIDDQHVATIAAQRWFEANHAKGWATCPITENAVMRIVGNPRYPNSPGSPVIVADTLRTLTEMVGHIFWPDAVSLLNTPLVNIDMLGGSARITDSYLLALAVHHDGQLVTFDSRLASSAVRGGDAALIILAP